MQLHTIGSPVAAAVTPPLIREPVFGTMRPLYLAAAASAGKLVSAIGASAAVKASYTDTLSDKIVAGALVGSGLTAAITAALMFGQDVHKRAPSKIAWAFKAVSISAALTLSAAAALHQLVVDSSTTDAMVWGTVVLDFAGYGLLCISLPNFFAYSEAEHGRAILRGRDTARQCIAALGVGFGFSWAVNAPSSQSLPPYLSQVLLALAATSTVMSLALARSNERYVALTTAAQHH